MALLQPVFDLFSEFSVNKWMYWTHMKAATFVVIKILNVGCHYEIRFSADIICDNSFYQHCTKDIQGSTPEQYLKLLARNNINQCHLMMAGEPSNWKLMKFKVKDNRLKKLTIRCLIPQILNHTKRLELNLLINHKLKELESILDFPYMEYLATTKQI